MDFDNYSLKELVEIRKKLNNKISSLENSLLKELRDKIKNLIFTDEEWKSFNGSTNQICNLTYDFYDSSWKMEGGLNFDTFRTWEEDKEVIKANFRPFIYRTLDENNKRIYEAKKKNPMFFKVAERLADPKLNEIMKEHENLGLDTLKLIDCYSVHQRITE